MALENMTSAQVDAIGRMSKQIYDEFRNLGYAGLSVDPNRFLAYRKQTNNDKFTQLVVSDAGVFFFDTARRIKYKFHPDYFLVYNEGLHAVDEEKLRNLQEPVVVLDNRLEFWKKPGIGFCLVADHLNHCQYLSEHQKAEMEKSQTLYKGDTFVIRPMLHKKIKETGPAQPSSTRTISLDE
ncbi:MAG TPA: hypothetical protein VJ873_10580 [bacterium]|nr:hypothetical protein [bacterium]